MAFSVSKGTYIRALARDLGRACDSAAHISALRRTASGVVSILSLIHIFTSTATEGRRKYAGKIAAATEANVTLELEDGESVTLDFSDVKKCKLKPTYDFKPAKEGK